MKFSTYDSLEAAREKLVSGVGDWFLSEEVIPIVEALDRIASRDVIVQENIPHFRRATVDGYAVVSSDITGASDGNPVALELKGQVEIGRTALFSINSGECAEISTGGMLPEGADAIVMWEFTENLRKPPFACEAPQETDGKISFFRAAAFGENVILPGDDAKPGDFLIKRGRSISPQNMGAMAAAGIVNISVYKLPKIAVISTGDELVSPNTTPALGQVRCVNSFSLAALAKKNGLEVTAVDLLPDSEDEIKNAVHDAKKDNDIILVSGGSSKGKRDFTAEAFKKISTPGVFVHGISIQPGKPTILAIDNPTKTLLVGLPGNPVSAVMVFELILGWLLRKIFEIPEKTAIPARLSCNVTSSSGRLTLRLCKLHFADGSLEDGTDYYIAEPVFGKSALIFTLTQADGYFIIPREAEGFLKGQKVLVHIL